MRSKISSLTLTLFCLFAAAPAWAAEGGGGNIFAGDIGNAFWTVLIFVLVIFVLGKYAWGPILSKLQEREDFIRESLETAKNEREQAEERLRKYEEKLAAARAEATALVEEGRRDAEVLRGRIEQEAKDEAEKTLERTKREIGIAKETAIKELYTAAGSLATSVASKIIEKELDPADHERLIADSIARLESTTEN